MSVEGVWPPSCGPKFDEGSDLGVLVLAFSNAGGGQLNGVNLKFESGLGEEVSMYVDAFLVLNDKVKFQREQLQLGERLPLSFRPGGQGFVIREEDKPSSSQLLTEIASCPYHGSHLQEKWREGRHRR